MTQLSMDTWIFSKITFLVKRPSTVVLIVNLDTRVQALEDITERLDKMRNLAGKKLDSIYQFVMAALRRKKMEKANAAKESASQSPLRVDDNASKNELIKRRLRKRLYALPKFYDGKLDLDRKLSLNELNALDFGRIPEHELKFYALNDPRVQA